ncbi:hypothetical protein BGZ73_000631 [Actinomortierella ambigua]|nr:hypothetical protein BGZ73_000631 [Actinomortierella ambigua]
MDTTNRKNGKRASKGKGEKSLTDQDVSWLEESSDKSPEAFFDRLNIKNCEDGHLRYARALRQSDLIEKERALLISNFEAWKSSDSSIYWERRNTKAVARKSAWKTAGNMIEGSEPFVETIIAENANEQRQCSSEVSDALHAIPSTPHQASTSPLTPNIKPVRKDNAKRIRTVTAGALPTKRIRLHDPWHELADIALRTYNGDAVDLPPEETKNTEKDPERQRLYGLAWRHLKDAKRASGQHNIDKESCLHFRDAFVALSGVFNLYSPMARSSLTSADCLDAKGLCLMPELEHRDEVLSQLLDSLKTSKIKKLAAVLEDLIENILNPHHGDNRPSECDALLIWGSILKDARPQGTPFTFYLGEQASLATRISKGKLACALNTGYSARKCDCTLSVGNVQFGNGEAKRASTPPVAVKIQLRKNIKIARSVMLELSKFGLHCPPQLSIHGLQADVFRVVPWKGVFVAAPACDPIVLPTTEAAWNPFIENTAHHLKNLLEYYHDYAVDAKEKIDVFNYIQKTVGQEEEEQDGDKEDDDDVENDHDLNEDVEFIDWNNVIFHTPTKPRVQKSIVSLSKPDNRRFQQKLQEAMLESEDEEAN